MKCLTSKWLVCFTIILFQGCGWDIYNIPVPRDIRKEDRKHIGDFVNLQISKDKSYQTYSPIGQNYLILDYLQTLYNQVNNELRLDIKSPESDRWNPDRQWQVRILKDESDIAFTIPGGDLYISSGLLKKLRFEADLYYILAVEAIIVQDQHLLEGLIEYYTITPLLELGQTDMDIENRFTDIHQVIAEMSYDAEAIQEIQYEAEALICRSSLYDPSVYASFSKELMPTSQWLTNRRLSLISSAQEPCGDLKTNGSYSEQVLEKLD